MSIELKPLPYGKKDLEPHLSEKTLSYHYDKHHTGYFNKLKAAISADSSLASMSLEDLIKNSSGGVFNNAAQVWNHSFYWDCMSPQGGGKPTGALLQEIEKSFGSFDEFQKQFNEAATTLFFFFFVWLVQGADKLQIIKTSNADCPIKEGLNPLLTLDVWEHAYYLDYQNLRPSYIESFWKLVNWSFVSSNLK